MFIIKNISEYLSTNSGKSSLRLEIHHVVTTACICLLLVCATLLIQASMKLQPDWLGASALVVALAGVITSALWGKNKGKEQEMINENKTT